MSPLTNEEKSFLLRLARRILEASVRGQKVEVPREIPPALEAPAGAFVSLHQKGSLRGCIGYVQPVKPLYRTVMEAVGAAARQDPRFEPVQPADLPELDLEISVLSSCWKVRPEEIQVGIHGLMITRHQARGLLLPQVAVEHHWDRERFLEETCRKAGLLPDAWRKGATIEAFTAEVFSEQTLAGEEQKGSTGAIPSPVHRPGKSHPG